MIEIQPPEQSDLAIYNPENGLNGYEHALAASESYWYRQMQNAHAEGRIVAYEISRNLFGPLAGLHDDWNTIQLGLATEDTPEPEYVRKTALSTLALGLFMRSNWKAMLDAGDAIGHGYSNYLIDMGEGNTGSSERVELKVHTTNPLVAAETPSSQTEQEKWYRTKNLFLKEVQPAEPTPTLIAALLEHEVTVDFATMRTVYPYLPARGAR